MSCFKWLILAEMLSLKVELWSPLSTTSDLQTSSRFAASFIQIRRLSGVFLPTLFSSSFRSGKESLNTASAIPHAVFCPGSGWRAGAQSPHFYSFHRGIKPPTRKSHSHKPSTGVDQRGFIPELSTIINDKVATEVQDEPWKRWKSKSSALLTAVTIHTTEVLLVCAVAQTWCWKEETLLWLESSNNGGSFTPEKLH